MKFSHSLLAAGALALAATGQLSAQVSITTWQGDNQHTGSNTNETILTPDNVKAQGNFGLQEFGTTDGQTYGQPLLLCGVTLSDGTKHNMVYLGTQHCSLYGFDADATNQTSATAPLQSVSMIPAGTAPTKQGTTPGTIASKDIDVEYGMTTTPVIDPAGNTIYAVSKVTKTSDNSIHQYLYAIDLTTFQPKFGSPVEIAPTFPGTASSGDANNPDSVNGVIHFNAACQHLRSAMTFYNGVVYLAYASHSDTNPYHGLIIGYDAKTLQIVNSFNSTPVGNLGAVKGAGIWASGAGPAVDASGNLFVSFANGAWDHTSAAAQTYGGDWGESVVKMDTSKTFAVDYTNTNNWFTPNNWDTLNGGDADLGSGGVTLLPPQSAGPDKNILVCGGKAGVLYVLNRDSLGGLHTPDAVIQEITEPTHLLNGNPTLSGIFVTPSYWNGSIYYAASGLPLEQRKVGYNAATGGYIADPPILAPGNGYNNRGCFISSKPNLTDGIAWVLEGNLQAFDASKVSNPMLVQVSTTVPVTNKGAGSTKFSLPIVANGRVYCAAYEGTGNIGHLFVFGLNPTPVGAPLDPSNATAVPLSASSVLLNWTDNSDNEANFAIYRATKSTGPFTTPVGTTGPNVSSYTDTGLTAATTYYYQVKATNAKGPSNATGAGPVTTFPTYADNGLVAYWSMDETSGATVHDLTGNGHDGSNVGEAYLGQASYINGAVYYHGTGQATAHTIVTNKADMQFAQTASYTVAAWVNPTFPEAGTFTEMTVFAKSRDKGNYYGIWYSADQHLIGRGFDGTNPVDLVDPGTSPVGGWTHVALVQDGAAKTRKLYVNGVLKITGAALPADGSGDLWLAHQNVSGNVEAMQGDLDEVRLYNRALSAGEITGLMGPPVLEAESSLTHGASGAFALPLFPNVTKKIECRKGSPVGAYNLVLHFSAPVSGFTATLQKQDGTAAPQGSSAGAWSYADATNKAVTVPVSGIGDVQALRLHLAGIQPGNGTADVPFNVLWGDVNGDNVVNAQDYTIVSKNTTATVSASTAPFDINVDGAVNVSDSNLVTPLEGTNLGAQLATNLALCATTNTSSHNGGNIADYAVDIYPTLTRWESTQKVDPQWIMLDLGTPCNIQQVVLNWETSSGKTYTVDVSTTGTSPDDPDLNQVNWTHLATETNNTTGNATGTNPHPPYVNPLTGAYRYVRMYGNTHNGNYGYSLFDFQVTGTVSATPAVPVVTSETVTASTNNAFSYQIKATNPPITKYTATGLPATLALDPNTGLITGKPTAVATINATIGATNSGGNSTTVPLTINVVAPYTAWQQTYFTAAELNNSSVSGPTATPAGDGITNLMKYALGLDPKKNGAGSLPAVSTTATGGSNYLTLTYTKNLLANDVTYLMEVSSDLATWSSGSSQTVVVSATNNADGKTQTVVVRDLTALGSGTPRRFARLRVSTP